MKSNWDEMYEVAKKYYETNQNLDVKSKQRTEEGIGLGAWIGKQRKNYRLNKLTSEQIELLNSIGMIWSKAARPWEENYLLAKAYYEYHGNLKIHRDFITTNGYDYDEDGIKLGIWIREQRVSLKENKLSLEQQDMLDEIGMIWNVNKAAWDKMYTLATKYYAKHKHLKIPINFRTKDGINYDVKGIHLGEWISNQRQAYFSKRSNGNRTHTLTNRQIFLLNDIEMIWDASLDSDKHWEQMYQLAKKYYQHHKNLDISSNFRTKDGHTYDKYGEKLGRWIQGQRRSYKAITDPKYAEYVPLTEEKINRLNEINMIWNTYDYNWYHNYAIVKTYYDTYHTLEAPISFRTKDGITYDEEGISIYLWLNQNRKAMQGMRHTRKLTENQINLLNEIGMTWKPNNKTEKNWLSYYALAKRYYICYQNLDMSTTFITKNGYEYDEKGKKLGAWISRQRYNYKIGKLNPERIKLLDEIEMIWQKQEKKTRFEKIDYSKAEEDLAYQELIAKINLLEMLKQPLIINGKPHPLIRMTDSELRKNFNISLEDLIYNFYSDEKSQEVKKTLTNGKTFKKRLIKRK